MLVNFGLIYTFPLFWWWKASRKVAQTETEIKWNIVFSGIRLFRVSQSTFDSTDFVQHYYERLNTKQQTCVQCEQLRLRGSPLLPPSPNPAIPHSCTKCQQQKGNVASKLKIPHETRRNRYFVNGVMFRAICSA